MLLCIVYIKLYVGTLSSLIGMISASSIIAQYAYMYIYDVYYDAKLTNIITIK